MGVRITYNHPQMFDRWFAYMLVILDQASGRENSHENQANYELGEWPVSPLLNTDITSFVNRSRRDRLTTGVTSNGRCYALLHNHHNVTNIIYDTEIAVHSMKSEDYGREKKYLSNKYTHKLSNRFKIASSIVCKAAFKFHAPPKTWSRALWYLIGWYGSTFFQWRRERSRMETTLRIPLSVTIV